MTELIFRYSFIYEQTLAKIAGSDFDYKKIDTGYKYTHTYNEHWKQYNNAIFAYYRKLGLNLPDFWLAYFVNPQKNLVPFSDPLTIVMKENLDEVTATVVHELCHVFLDFYSNQEIYKKLHDHTEKNFSQENFTTKIHLIVNVLTRYGLIEIFGLEKTNQLLNLEKNYPGLKRAWEIIDSKQEIFQAEDPITAILSL